MNCDFNLSRPSTITASSTLVGLLTSRVSVLMMEAVGEDLDQDAKGTPHIPKPRFKPSLTMINVDKDLQSEDCAHCCPSEDQASAP